MHYRTDLFGDADLQAKFEAQYGYPLAPPTTLEQMSEMAEFFVGEGAVKYGTQFAGKEEALAGRFYEISSPMAATTSMKTSTPSSTAKPVRCPPNGCRICTPKA